MPSNGALPVADAAAIVETKSINIILQAIPIPLQASRKGIPRGESRTVGASALLAVIVSQWSLI